MADAGARLLELARSRFSDLTPVDQRLFAHAAMGTVADFEGPPAEEIEGEWLLPWDEAAWTPDQTVRTDVLRWLCSDRQASSLVDLRGIRVRAALIAERLDLAYATVTFPLEFERCAFPNGVDVQGATLKVLSLAGSRCRDLTADRVDLDGDIRLTHGFRAEGGVSLASGEIGSTLDCSSATLINSDGDHALFGDGMTVNGSVFLRDGFRAEGTVSLTGTRIDGSLECDSARLSNPDGDHALFGQSMTVKQEVFLRDGFRAEGEVSLSGAEIGELDCSNATFINPEGDALLCQALVVKGSIFLNQGFWAEGEVSLSGAAIGGQLACNRATFSKPEGDALFGQSMTVNGSAYLRDGFWANGRVSLLEAEIGGTLDCRKGSFGSLDLSGAAIGTLVDDSNSSWPDDGELSLDGLTYRSIGRVPGGSTERKAWIKNRLRWIRRQPGYAPQPYTELRNFLHREGHEAEARTVAIARQTDFRKFGSLPLLPRLWNWVLGFTIAHGYAPWRPLILGIPVIILGSFIYTDAHSAGLLIASQDALEPRFNALMYSLDTFMPIVDFNEQGRWQPSGVGTNGMWVQRFYWFEIALGWIISTLFVLSFTRLVRQD